MVSTELLAGFFRRTRNLILVSAALVGLQEVAVILIALSATTGLSGNLGSSAVYVSFFLFFGSIILQLLQINFREKTPNPLLAWLFLHTLYWLPSAINGVILFAAILYIVGGSSFFLNWPLLLGFMIIISWFFDYFLLQGIGQEYQTLRGGSWAGAAAFARLAKGMFQRKRREGLTPLMKSLGMAQNLFSLRRYAPEDLDAVYSTVSAFSDTPSIDFKSLVDLTKALETLPRLDELPLALAKFLRETKWPGMFKPVPSRRTSTSQRFVVFLAGLTALSTFLTALPDEARRGFFNAIGSFLVSNFSGIVSFVVLILAIIVILYAVIYWVPVWYVRKFWPREQ